MANIEEKNQTSTISEMVARLSQLRSEILTGQLAHKIGDDVLKPIVDEVDSLAKALLPPAKVQDYTHIERFFALSIDMLCIAGPDATFKKLNPSFTRILGYSESDLLSKPFLEFVHPGDLAATIKEVDKLAAGQATISFENRYKAKDGTYRTLSWNSGPDPETGFIYAVARDVTDANLAEMEFKNVSERLDQAKIISKIGFWVLDLETNEFIWSRASLAMFGVELEGQPLTLELLIGFTHSEDQGKLQEEFSRLIENKVKIVEFTFRRPIENGKPTCWIKLRATLEVSNESLPLRISGSFQDISQEKNAEIELHKTLEDLKATSTFLENTGRLAKVGGWELDLGTGRVKMTKETRRIHAIGDDYVPPKYSTGAEWYPPDAWPIIKAAVEEAIQHNRPYDVESPFINAKGQALWVRVQGFPVKVDDKVTYLHGTFQDISERKQIEQQAEFVRESMGFGVWTFDPLSKALVWDHRMYELFGVQPNDFSDANSVWENAFSPEEKEAALKDRELALSGEKELNTEFEILLKTGEKRYLGTRGVVVRDEDGKATLMHGLNWDVTNRVQAEIELRSANSKLVHTSKLASLGEMAAGMAHEINNPLTILIGSVRSLPKFVHDPPQLAKKIATIQLASERITKIVRSLRKYSRSEEKPVYTQHSLAAIVKEALILTYAKSQMNSTPVQAEFKSEGFTHCDEIEIEQVVINLINNGIDAVKECEEKWVKVQVLEDEASISISVTDSGCGIDEQIKLKLFQPFFTTKPVGQGTGLGLSIVKGILDEHNATIEVVADDPNTCFLIKFPKLKD